MGKGSKRPPVKVAPVESKPGLGGTTFGGFADPGYISIDDDYEKRIEVPSRHVGSNMTTSPGRKGKTPDVFFDKTVRRMEDKFNDPGKSETEKKLRETQKKMLLSGPWKQPSPAKKATGPGTYTGTFSEKAPHSHQQDYDVIKRGEKPEPPKKQAKNISVHFNKTGGYGMCGNGIYFSNPEPPKEGKSDPYDYQRVKEREERAAAKKKELGANGSKPFRSASKSKGTFDETDASGVSKVFSIEKPLPPLKEKTRPEKEKTLAGPFKFTSPPKRGEAGNLNPFPKTLEGKPDVYDSKQLKEKEERKKAPKFVGGTWKATSAPKLGCTRSLLKRCY